MNPNNKDEKRQSPIEENTAGREMAKLCNPQLKEVNDAEFKMQNFARFFVIKS